MSMAAPTRAVGEQEVGTGDWGLGTGVFHSGVVRTFRSAVSGQASRPALLRSEKRRSVNREGDDVAYEMTVGLLVEDQARYAQYRIEIRPLLEESGGAFRYDFIVSQVLQSENGTEINRVFVIRFPDQSSKERFFADPRYLEIRHRLFEPAVKASVTIAECLRDGPALPPPPRA